MRRFLGFLGLFGFGSGSSAADSTWPHTQEKVAAQLAGLSDAEVERVTWRNASELFDHRVPEAVQRDPDAY